MFQAEVELLQSVEVRLKEEMAAQREIITGLESAKVELTSKLDVSLLEHESYVKQMESKMAEIKVGRISIQLLIFKYPFE